MVLRERHALWRVVAVAAMVAGWALSCTAGGEGTRKLPLPNGWTRTRRIVKTVDTHASVAEKAIEYYRNSVGMEFVSLPAGTRQIGTDDPWTIAQKAGLDPVKTLWETAIEAAARYQPFCPRHDVTLSVPVYLGATEVPQSAYTEIMGGNPSARKGGDLPVENVSWRDAMEFCRRLSAREGVAYRLPTEAEWEAACGGKVHGSFNFGEHARTDMANFDGTRPFDIRGGKFRKGVFRKTTVPIGSLPANALGVFEMHGNVMEWCLDRYGAGFYYAGRHLVDPQGPVVGDQRVLRGGSWVDAPWDCLTVTRKPLPEDGAGAQPGTAGFRVVCAPLPPDSTQQPALWASHQEEIAVATPEDPKGQGNRLITYYRNSIGMEFVRVAAGAFAMGAPSDEPEHDPDEEPRHSVRISNSFYLGACEVTRAEYAHVMGVAPSRRHPHETGWRFGGRPTKRWSVDSVSWEDAMAFCRALSRLEGKTYRLPTEAEWEYACRAGSETRFSYGDAYGRSSRSFAKRRPGQPYSAEGYPANAWGLFDMHGHLWEWCADWYAEDYYSRSPECDPSGPETGTYRVIRGGSFCYPSCCRRSAYRHRDLPGHRVRDAGFRVVLEIQPEEGRDDVQQ